ncbi:hypothetical protein D623_10022663 [Myotis brandtii]|uniref:Uncharacterized protein n=1 Tax=Myotis brandtii TaxID=109478 RepID=S7N955_MYOBR|nr:hypothetical protein D623_10022663 [Myotis brandtii]
MDQLPPVRPTLGTEPATQAFSITLLFLQRLNRHGIWILPSEINESFRFP